MVKHGTIDIMQTSKQRNFPVPKRVCLGDIRLPYLPIKQKADEKNAETIACWVIRKANLSSSLQAIQHITIHHVSKWKEKRKNHPWWWHNTKIQCLFARAQYLPVRVEQQIYFVMFCFSSLARERQHNTKVNPLQALPNPSRWQNKNTFVMFMCCRFSFFFPFYILFGRIGK